MCAHTQEQVLFNCITTFDSSKLMNCSENITTFAGINGGTGLINGKGIQSKFNNPWSLCFNPNSDCFFICDYGNNAIRKLALSGIFILFLFVKFFMFLYDNIDKFY
jgi:hypothetical protein